MMNFIKNDFAIITNYLGVYVGNKKNEDVHTKHDYITYIDCKMAENNMYKIMDIADGYAVCRCIEDENPFNILVRLDVLRSAYDYDIRCIELQDDNGVFAVLGNNTLENIVNNALEIPDDIDYDDIHSGVSAVIHFTNGYTESIDIYGDDDTNEITTEDIFYELVGEIEDLYDKWKAEDIENYNRIYWNNAAKYVTDEVSQYIDVADGEVYRQVPDYENYAVSNKGNVFSFNRNRLIKPDIVKKDNYVKVRVKLRNEDGGKRKRVSHLVYRLFDKEDFSKEIVYDETTHEQIHHRNLNPLDNAIGNLMFVGDDPTHNILHRKPTYIENQMKKKIHLKPEVMQAEYDNLVESLNARYGITE